MSERISKILVDNNLSVRLPEVLASDFPGSVHVATLELTQATDTQLWELAQREHFAIMTRDKDFYYRVSVFGSPPSVIWITRGNCSNRELIALVRQYIPTIRSFIASSQALLVIS
ncbi:MAG: DUF5615 family PIN-like protein [Tunicatimonas sp.]